MEYCPVGLNQNSVPTAFQEGGENTVEEIYC